MDQWTHQADLGIVLLDDIQYNTDHYLTKMENRPEFHSDRWHRWYLERLIVFGQWETLQTHLNNRGAFGFNTIQDEVFLSWADFLMGNTSRAQERLNTLVFSEKDYDVIHDGESATVYRPKSMAASCKLGASTKWCTSAGVNNPGQNWPIALYPLGQKFKNL